jgi:hypothetical protein
MHDYDFANEELKWLYPWARKLSYGIERWTQCAATVIPRPGELLLGFGWSGDVMRVFSVTVDRSCDGVNLPSVAIFGSLSDPRTIQQGRISARWQYRWVGPFTRWRLGKLKGLPWYRRFE